MMLFRSAVPFLALLALAPAQDPAFRFVPKDAALVVRMGAPARWKKDFADTALAKLMAAPALQPMMQQAGQMMDAMMAEARDSGFDADLVERMLATYEGDFVVSVAVDWKKAELVSVDGEEPTVPVFMSFAATPHASYDLAALAKAIDGAATKAMEDAATAPKSRELAVGDLRLRCVEAGDGMWGTMPALVDGHLVMFVGADLDAGVAKAIEGADRFEAADAAGKPMFLHADVRGFVGAMEKSMAELEEMGALPFDMGEMLDAIGLRALQSLRMTMAADGKQLVSETHVAMLAEKRGLMGVMPQTAAQPKLLRAIPASASNWTVLPLDLGALYASAEAFVTLMESEMPMSWSDMMATMAEELKVRLKEDLLDHLGGEVLLLNDASEVADMEDDSPLAGVGGMCMAFALRDGAAFEKSLETMLRSRGLHAARKTEEYQGARIHRMTLAAVLPLEYAVTNDVLLLALGDGEATRASLRGVLDAKAAGGAELPAAVKAQLESAPAGWCGVGLSRPADQMQAIATSLQTVLASTGLQDDAEMAELDTMAGVLAAAAGEMKRLGLETAVGFVYSGPTGITYRMRW